VKFRNKSQSSGGSSPKEKGSTDKQALARLLEDLEKENIRWGKRNKCSLD
jgi:hypothetical protein